MISAAENCKKKHTDVFKKITALAKKSKSPVLGITGTGGAGKSSLVDELVRRFIIDSTKKNIAIISVDQSKIDLLIKWIHKNIVGFNNSLEHSGAIGIYILN